MFPQFLMTDEQIKRADRRLKEEAEARIPHAVPWTSELKWQPKLAIKAVTYKPLSLFNVKPATSPNVNRMKKGDLVVSPKGTWCYCEKILPRGAMIHTAYGREVGDVLFDGDVIIPALHTKDRTGGWDPNPWMSLTPLEMMTLRPGTRRAKGHTIIAGLGLGHQLIEVSKRKQVSQLTLVERSQELMDWLLPKIRPLLGRRLHEVIVGDAMQLLPSLKADVALVDIFHSYGSNSYERDKLRDSCFTIGHIWAWGASDLRDSW